MGLDQGWDSSRGGASFSILFKALKIELKVQNSSYGLNWQHLNLNPDYCRISWGIS